MSSWLRRILYYTLFLLAVLAIIIMLAGMGFPVAVLAIIPIGFAFVLGLKRSLLSRRRAPLDSRNKRGNECGWDCPLRLTSRHRDARQIWDEPLCDWGSVNASI